MATQTIKHSTLPKRIFNRYITRLINRKASETNKGDLSEVIDQQIQIIHSNEARLATLNHVSTVPERLIVIR
jgi:hypothetical protein